MAAYGFRTIWAIRVIRRPAMSNQTAMLFATILLAVPFAPLARAADPVVPNAGSILQQIQPPAPGVPPSSESGLTINQQDRTKLPAGAPFLVNTIQIVGNKTVSTASLHALVADAEGKSLTLQQLNDVASRITDHYHRLGFALARAIIPAQTIEHGIVRIQIVVADYGQISLDNRSKVNDALLTATLAPLQSGTVIDQTVLDRALLLVSDMPGVAVTAVLKPGVAVETSDLLVSTRPGPAVTGNLALDDYGSRYTGRPRVGGTVSFINPLHQGDVLTLNALSAGAGMNYGRLAYESLLNGSGTRAGGSWSELRYVLGEPLVALKAHGTAEVQSLWIRHPLVRSRDFNLYAQVQYDRLQLSDHLDASNILNDRSLKSGTFSLAGDAHDALVSGGINIWSLGWTSGRVGFDNASALSHDAATARTRGNYSKWNASLIHLQYLTPQDGLYLAASGQWASGNLDASQKLSGGGPYTVRAYDTGALSGDAGYLLTAEYRRNLGPLGSGQWMAVAYVDSAQLIINKNTWATGENTATLSGAGIGIHWTGSNQWNARIHVAVPIGPKPTLVERVSSTQTWVEVSRWF
jgi:hemolysin activation/secretion protein